MPNSIINPRMTPNQMRSAPITSSRGITMGNVTTTIASPSITMPNSKYMSTMIMNSTKLETSMPSRKCAMILGTRVKARKKLRMKAMIMMANKNQVVRSVEDKAWMKDFRDRRRRKKGSTKEKKTPTPEDTER